MQILLSRSRKWLSLLSRSLHHDFCPNANQYVYWLKQPIAGSFFAIAVSLLVSIYANANAWPVAISLVGVVIIGLLFPWLAVRMSSVSIHPIAKEVEEMETTSLVLQVKNWLPIPIWGFIIEGYLASPLPPAKFGDDAGDQDLSCDDTGLACVPPLSHASYHLPIAAEFRGCYPSSKVFVSCAFHSEFGRHAARSRLCDRSSFAQQLLELLRTSNGLGKNAPLLALAKRLVETASI